MGQFTGVYGQGVNLTWLAAYVEDALSEHVSIRCIQIAVIDPADGDPIHVELRQIALDLSPLL